MVECVINQSITFKFMAHGSWFIYTHMPTWKRTAKSTYQSCKNGHLFACTSLWSVAEGPDICTQSKSGIFKRITCVTTMTAWVTSKLSASPLAEQANQSHCFRWSICCVRCCLCVYSLPRQAVFPLWCSRSCPLGAPGFHCETGTWQSKSRINTRDPLRSIVIRKGWLCWYTV